MRFACLVYFEPKAMFGNTPEMNAVLAEAGADRQRLMAAGIVPEALVLPDAAVTVRIRGGQMARTDGPFMETKEVLGGFYIIDAPDMDGAVREAARNPMAKLGAVEVRPVVDFSQPRPVL